MAMFGNSARKQIRPFVPELEASMGADGAYSTQLNEGQQLAPRGPGLAGYYMKSGQAPSALTDAVPRMSADPAFSPNQQLQMPVEPQGPGAYRGGGMFGGERKRSGFSKFLNGAGKVLETAGAVAAFGPFAPIALRKMKEDRQFRGREREADLGLREAQADYYRAQADAKDDGLLVVGNKLVRRNAGTGMPEVVIDGRSPGEREQWLAELDDPATPPERRDNLKRVLGLTPAPTNRAPSYQTDDNGDVFEVGPGGVRKIGGGLFKRPPAGPQPREPREPSIGGALTPVVQKWLRGEPLTPTEAQALNWYQQNGRRVPTVQPGVGSPPAVAGPAAPPPTRRPPPPAPKLDANGNVPNPFGLNTASPPPLIGRGAPPRPNPAGGNAKRVRLPAGYTPAKALSEARLALKANPANRRTIEARLQSYGVDPSQLGR